MGTIPATTTIIPEFQPIIKITDATPPRPQPVHRRLLYRGALSLPDSHLLLDGLTFSGYDTNKGTPGFCLSLLENPLALALESMRGRRTLRFLGVVSLSEGWVDYSGGVQLDIHAEATLSQIYFENIFCLSGVAFKDGRSCTGVKVALGDSNGPDTTEIVIYTQPVSTPRPPESPTTMHMLNSPAPAHGITNQGTLHLHVARISPTPPAASPTVPTNRLRLPRPDDPTPRKIPISFSRSLSSSHAVAGPSKRASSTIHAVNPKRRKTDKPANNEPLQRRHSAALEDPGVMLGAAVRGASGPGRSRSLLNIEEGDGAGNAVFKIPDVPVRSRSRATLEPAIVLSLDAPEKGKAKDSAEEDEDVFGTKAAVNVKETGRSAKAKGKRRSSEDDLGDVERAGQDVGEIEKANRAKIKKQTVKLLSTPVPSAPGDHVLNVAVSVLPARAIVTKTHPEFKDIFGYVYRGVAFALRAAIQTGPLSTSTVDSSIQAHLALYVPDDLPGHTPALATTGITRCLERLKKRL
ncbi:hypothetical protein FIBSPDRAFT_1049732 [Athelia psychrophila]|uniref:Sld7 C-terminal domain-containing protein n=1 Tax=Athelia psychrophila TaxID=1759441 RepID=A0A166BVY2_9AGAM|nr:hypothetical protein FIBSPDRAFT_1049732 [Fibularhizoctonia sp. CBS 109695]